LLYITIPAWYAAAALDSLRAEERQLYLATWYLQPLATTAVRSLCTFVANAAKCLTAATSAFNPTGRDTNLSVTAPRSSVLSELSRNERSIGSRIYRKKTKTN
jgi:hypothetical protein